MLPSIDSLRHNMRAAKRTRPRAVSGNDGVRPMNLYLYLLGSILGVALIVALNLVLLGRARALVDLDAAKALLAAEYPGFQAQRAVLARDSRVALIEDDTGGLYLVAGAGDTLVSRALLPGSVRAVARNGESLSIRFRDFTFPRAGLALGDAAEAKAWEARLARAL